MSYNIEFAMTTYDHVVKAATDRIPRELSGNSEEEVQASYRVAQAEMAYQTFLMQLYSSHMAQYSLYQDLLIARMAALTHELAQALEIQGPEQQATLERLHASYQSYKKFLGLLLID